MTGFDQEKVQPEPDIVINDHPLNGKEDSAKARDLSLDDHELENQVPAIPEEPTIKVPLRSKQLIFRDNKANQLRSCFIQQQQFNFKSSVIVKYPIKGRGRMSSASF
jgi:hypothetical protein